MRRHLVPASATLCFAAFAVLYAVDRPVYLALLDAIHVHPFPRPFLDTRFVTAQVECWSRGVDVYARNPCDPLGRTMDYSPLWLRLPFLARPDGWTPVFGLAVDGAFLWALFTMPWNVGGATGRVVGLAAVLSWATMFAMERGNTDLLMFAAAVWFARLATGAAAARGAGYALVLGAGLLKFYPLVLLALVVREPARRAWVIGGVCALVLLGFVAFFHAELARIGANMANALFGDMFGARSLPFGIPLLFGLAPLRDAFGLYVGAGALDPAGAALGWTLFAGLSVACWLIALLWGRDPRLRDALVRIDPAERMLLLAGGVLVVGCFFGHQNIGYRAVMLLLVLPGLLALARGAPERSMRLLFGSTAVLVVTALWDGIVSRSIPGWIVLQLAWWWIVCVLLSIVVGLLRDDVARLVGRSSGRVRRRQGQRPAVGPEPDHV